ncbi:unnamed protein product [Arctia plantaginis]|uniref:Major facilitator superfamily (MFS) profile domain-containing protein n=1 Tax=Arctia plantaginis TaxID=874455 RepID=A0A8S1A767_ARCPL|nr:unnamed protein product [Arctia plantaginis]
MAYYNIILALTITPHTCKLPVKPENISEYNWKTTHIPRQESVAGTEKFSGCLIYTNLGSNETESCDVFDYDKTWFQTTVPSDNNWVCENEINVANILAYSRIAELIGSFFFGWFGDLYGRKLTFIISIFMLVIGRFISILTSSSLTFFTIGCIVAWFPSWSAPQSTAIISLEISSSKRRASVAKLKLVATSLGMFLMPFFYWWLRNWQFFLIITTALQLPFLIFSWKLIESPQWLWIKGRSRQTLKTLKYISKINKTDLHPDTESEILTKSPSKANKTEVLGLLALLSSWRIVVTTMLQLLLWFAISLNYGVAVLSSGEKSEGNPFLDFAWQSLAEIPGFFVAAWLANSIGRRYTGIVSFSLTTTIWILYGLREISNTGWVRSEALDMFLVITNRASITVSYYLINLLNMELYPTCLRQSGMSLGNLVSSGASAIAPYVLYLGRKVDVRCPSVILTATTLLGGIIPIFFLPETLNKKLPETLEDAKNF